MAIIDNTDVEVSCDGCGATANVDVTNEVLQRLARRDWATHGSGEVCPECAARTEESES